MTLGKAFFFLMACTFLTSNMAGCTPVSHKPSRFQYGDPYSPDPREPRPEKYQ